MNQVSTDVLTLIFPRASVLWRTVLIYSCLHLC